MGVRVHKHYETIYGGLSFTILRETEKAVLAEVSTSDNRRPFQQWIPKSIIIEDRTELVGRTKDGADEFFNVYVELPAWFLNKLGIFV